jgi:NMD protein affecting ribosome stability and mRNA decay
VIACPSCGKENPEGFQFCGFCTAPLHEATVEVRKIVTIVFCVWR